MVLSASPTLTGTLTAAIANFSGAVGLTAAIPQLTLGVLNTTSGGILMYGSTSGSLTLKPAAAAGAGVTITLPATSVTLNAAGDLTGTTLAANVTASSLTSLGTLTSLAVTGAITGASYSGAVNFTSSAGTDYVVGSFTSTATAGWTTTPTATVKYTKIGNTVIMEWPGTMAGTSNATNATADAIPVALRPAAQKISNGLRMIDNGAGDVWGTTVINTDGTIAFYRDAAATNWTNSGSKTIDSGVVIYTLQ